MSKNADRMEEGLKRTYLSAEADVPAGLARDVMAAVSAPHTGLVDVSDPWQPMWRLAQLAAAAAIAVAVFGYAYFVRGTAVLGWLLDDPSGLTSFVGGL